MSHDLDTLNRLIGRLRAAARGYRAASSDGVVGFMEAFDANAAAHDRTAGLLGDEVRALGGSAAAEAPATDGVPHSWTQLGPALAQGPPAVGEAMARIEAELLVALHEAADDVHTSAPVRDAIRRACDGLKARQDSAQRQMDAIGA